MAEEAQNVAATSAVALVDEGQSLPVQTKEAADDTKGSMCGGVQVSQSLSALTEKVAARCATTRAKRSSWLCKLLLHRRCRQGQSICPRVAFKDGLIDYPCVRLQVAMHPYLPKKSRQRIATVTARLRVTMMWEITTFYGRRYMPLRRG